jgi:hypothetical protein
VSCTTRATGLAAVPLRDPAAADTQDVSTTQTVDGSSCALESCSALDKQASTCSVLDMDEIDRAARIRTYLDIINQGVVGASHDLVGDVSVAVDLIGQTRFDSLVALREAMLASDGEEKKRLRRELRAARDAAATAAVEGQQ